MIHAIPNKWLEKIKAKKEPETAPSYKQEKYKEMDASKPKKRFTLASTQSLVKTLRGIRK